MMKTPRLGRRKFLSGMAGSAAFLSALPPRARPSAPPPALPAPPAFPPPPPRPPRPAAAGAAGPAPPPAPPRIKFAVIGINHSHIYSQVEAVQRGGGELVSLFAIEPDLADAFLKRFPQAKRARS